MLLKQKQKSNLRIRRNNKGVTLVEVIAMIAVLSVVMAAVTGFMLSSAKMSAQVSDSAGASIREQSAVEFINKTLYKTTITTDSYTNVLEDDRQPESETQTYYATLLLELNPEAPEKAPKIYSSEGVVVYEVNGNTTELCSGEIYFIKDPTSQTVTYVLNGIPHTVHSRIGS